MKAISDLRKPKRKSDTPYKLKTTIQNCGRVQKTESVASNESAVEQIQGAASEAAYRATQIPPQIRYAVRKYQRKIEQQKRREQEHTYVENCAGILQEHIPPSHDENIHRQQISSGKADKTQTTSEINPKQKSQIGIKTKEYVEQQRISKHIRPEKVSSSKANQTIAQRTAEHGRRRFQKNVQKQAIQQAQTAGKSAGVLLEKAGTAFVHAVRSMVSYLAASLGAVGFVMIISLALLVAAVAASPFGIFLANEPSPNTIPLSSAVAQINMELNERLIELQDGDYEEIKIHGTQPEWTDVIAVFAAHIAGAEDGMSVAQLDGECVELLRDTFWDMCSISSRIETEEIPTTDPGEPTERPEETLHITILSKSTARMRQIYRFNDFQNEALDALLEEEGLLLAAIGDLSIAQQDAMELLENLPDNLSPERLAVVRQALMLVGKVNYFWGGKSRVIGWDNRWGQLRKVTSPGSKTTGTYRPFGLDCSGFVDWVFYNISDGDYLISHGGGAAGQHRYCMNISWAEVLPGDLVFYSGDDHVGIVGGWDENGNILIIHCASGYNNVVITGKRGFASAGRPHYYGK